MLINYNKKRIIENNPIFSKYDRLESILFICNKCYAEIGYKRWVFIEEHEQSKIKRKNSLGNIMSYLQFNQAISNFTDSSVHCNIKNNNITCLCGAEYQISSKNIEQAFFDNNLTISSK